MPDDTVVRGMATFLPIVHLMLQNIAEIFNFHNDNPPINDAIDDSNVGSVHQTLVDMEIIVASVLHDFRPQNVGAILPEDLGWWVLPCSTI